MQAKEKSAPVIPVGPRKGIRKRLPEEECPPRNRRTESAPLSRTVSREIKIALTRKAPAALQWHKTETRISAIAHFARGRKQKKKALLLSLFDRRWRS